MFTFSLFSNVQDVRTSPLRPPYCDMAPIDKNKQIPLNNIITNVGKRHQTPLHNKS